MSTDLLSEHFATLATAPDGMARLRELILQLAIQGKLGTQDAGDEPASEILKKIDTNDKPKKRVTHNKKGNSLDISQDEQLFQIPPSWVWIKLERLSNRITDGTHITPTYLNHGIPFISTSNITPFKEGFDFSTYEKYISSDEHLELTKRSKPEKGDLLISKCGSIGKTKLVDVDFDFSIFVGLGLVKLKKEYVNGKYLEVFLNSESTIKILESFSPGSTRPTLPINKIGMIPIPLPPLAEQHRIVAKVDRLMALCDELEARQQQERAGCLKLSSASLAGLQNAGSPEKFEAQWAQVCDAFELILDCPENVAVLRQTILQLAVQGRLVRQDPEDEPVEKLAMKIQKERFGNVTRQETINPVNNDDALFPIPTNWKWYRIGDIFNTSSGSTPLRTKLEYFIDGTENWVKTTDLNNGLVLSCQEFITKNAVKDYNLKYYPIGTVCIAMYGGAGTIGKSGILGMETTINQSVFGISPSSYIRPEFFHLYVKAIRPKWMKHAMGLRKAPNINGIIIKRMPFPLPPLSEQHRIIAKVDALMALCDALEARLKERAQVQTKFTGAVVKNIVMG